MNKNLIKKLITDIFETTKDNCISGSQLNNMLWENFNVSLQVLHNTNNIYDEIGDLTYIYFNLKLDMCFSVFNDLGDIADTDNCSVDFFFKKDDIDFMVDDIVSALKKFETIRSSCGLKKS